jgi:uncharacterized protein YqeY
MSLRVPIRLGKALQRSAPLRTAYPTRICSALRFYSDEASLAPPPLLLKLKGDLKTAMRAKDAPRLSVLRAIMSANLNASKTDKPIRTDLQLIALIRKMERNAAAAIEEAKAANRDDLVEKEQLQADILHEYVEGSGVKSIGVDELKAIIQTAIKASRDAGEAEKSMTGAVIKRVKAATDGQDVDNKELASLVREALQ